MEYNDERILSAQEYELMAKEYAKSIKNKGFIFVQIDSEEVSNLAEETFSYLAKSKACLLTMGGFLNTSSFYSLNERQIKKLRIIFDYDKPLENYKTKHDKTACFLMFIGLEARILKNLMQLSEKSNFERELKIIYQDRLTMLENIFKID